MSLRTIDLRSDTVTLPTEEMRKAMYTAECGDDVFGEDPTVNDLEAQGAALAGKEAGLFVPSGTMANIVCILTNCGRGDEVIVGNLSHTFLNEVGAMAGLGGVHPHTVVNQPDGTMRLDDIEHAIRGDNVHWPRTKLLCLENTHNRCFGAPLSPEYTDSAADIARQHNMQVHLDGARVFNAAVALGVDVKVLTRSVDTVCFCLSKGLAAPIGSLVCGSRAFINEARRTRKMLGGGMRQVGVIAAPGMIAISTMIQRLKDDHENARYLAEGVSRITGLTIEIERVQTNIIYFELTSERRSPEAFLECLAAKGVKVLRTGTRQFRMVTHHGIERTDIDTTLDVLREVTV